MLVIAQPEERRVVVAEVASSNLVDQPILVSWRSLVAHSVVSRKVAGSNPVGTANSTCPVRNRSTVSGRSGEMDEAEIRKVPWCREAQAPATHPSPSMLS